MTIHSLYCAALVGSNARPHGHSYTHRTYYDSHPLARYPATLPFDTPKRSRADALISLAGLYGPAGFWSRLTRHTISSALNQATFLFFLPNESPWWGQEQLIPNMLQIVTTSTSFFTFFIYLAATLSIPAVGFSFRLIVFWLQTLSQSFTVRTLSNLKWILFSCLSVI